MTKETQSGKICPECDHEFQGNGWDGIDAHWRAKHENAMPYHVAWPQIKAGFYRRRTGSIENFSGSLHRAGTRRPTIEEINEAIESGWAHAGYTIFQDLDPFFEVVQKGLEGLVDGYHYFDTIAEDAIFEFRYDFPGWPKVIQGRANLMTAYSGYGNNITIHSADGLAVYPSTDGKVVVLEYEAHGTIVKTGAAYDNRFVSIVTIENRKIVRWRDYMDSLAAWTALNSKS